MMIAVLLFASLLLCETSPLPTGTLILKFGLASDVHLGVEGVTQESRGYRFPDAEKLNDEFHVYGYEWTPEDMSFFVDGVRYFTVPIGEAHDYAPKSTLKGMAGHHDFHSVIFNNEIFTPGHGWCPDGYRITDGDVPIEYWIDWIRLYQKDGEEIRVLGGQSVKG